MEKTSDFTELIVWQKAHQFVLQIYSLTSRFPREELFGITSQMRRAAISIAANVAEGYTKRGLKDKARFFNIAQGSLSECKYYLILIRDLKFSTDAKFASQLDEVSRLLNSYKRTVEKNDKMERANKKISQVTKK